MKKRQFTLIAIILLYSMIYFMCRFVEFMYLRFGTIICAIFSVIFIGVVVFFIDKMIEKIDKL